MKNKMSVLGLAFCFMFMAALSLQAATKVLDATNTNFGWQVLTDKPPAASLEVGAGPRKGGKGLVLSYKFEEGIWLAMVKTTNFALGEKDALRFYYKGSGATVNLKIKITDAGGAVFGYTCPAGTSVPEWREVEVPRSQFQYLWGGQGADSMNWGSLVKLEFTLDQDKITTSTYTIDKSMPGKVNLSTIEIVSKK